MSKYFTSEALEFDKKPLKGWTRYIEIKLDSKFNIVEIENIARVLQNALAPRRIKLKIIVKSAKLSGDAGVVTFGQ